MSVQFKVTSFSMLFEWVDGHWMGVTKYYNSCTTLCTALKPSFEKNNMRQIT